MRIKEEFKKSGYFWLPSVPDKRIPGILSILDGGVIKLELFGVFGTLDEPEPIKRIVGHLEKGGFVTLDDCHCRRMSSSVDTSRTFDDISRSYIDVMRVFKGVAYRESEIPHFDTLTFFIAGIDEWVGISGIEEDYQFENHAATISYKLPANIPLKLDNGMELSIAFDCQLPLSLNRKEIGITQKTYFHLVSQDARELDEFISIANKLTTFLCFAINEVVYFDSVSTVFDTPHQDVRENLRSEIPVDIYFLNSLHSKNDPEIYEHKMLFEFEKIQDRAETIINNWIKGCEQSGAVFHLYVWAQRNAYPYLETRFLSLVQGLEIYHRGISNEKEMDEAEFEQLVENLIKQCPQGREKWLEGRLRYGNEVSLRKRITRLIEPFKDLFGNKGKRKKLVNRIVDTRNNLTHHHLEREDIDDLWVLSQKMEALVQLLFLQMIGFGQEEIRSIVWNCNELKQTLSF